MYNVYYYYYCCCFVYALKVKKLFRKTNILLPGECLSKCPRLFLAPGSLKENFSLRNSNDFTSFSPIPY